MFICNFKINSSIIFKIVLGVIVLIVICMSCIVGYKIYKESLKNDSCTTLTNLIEPTNNSYASILESVHTNLEEHVGQKIKYSGFVYRVYDLNKEQFVLARNMVISSDFQTVVVGFLCHYKNAIKLKDGIWVEIEGIITKDTYQGKDMPILEINTIKEIEKPIDEYVYPPDDNYIPTSSIL